jgi:probable O-glycosylation ligase (exosortase A-associated)
MNHLLRRFTQRHPCHHMDGPPGKSITRTRMEGIGITVLFCLATSAVWYLTFNPLFALVLSLAPIGILLVISQNFWSILLFVIFSFFRIHEVIPQLYPLKIPLLLSASALLGILWHLCISKQLRPYWHPSLTWLVLFWLLVIIGIIFASNRGIALGNFKGIYWKIIVMTLAIMWVINSPRHFNTIAVMITLSGLLVGCVALSNAANGIGLVEGSRVTIGRAIGSMLGDPNDLALVLMFPFAFSISVALTAGQPWHFRLLCVAICTILFLAILATQSRGGLLGILAVSGVFALKYIRSKALLLLLGFCGALFLYLVGGLSDRSSGGAAEAGIDASAMGRLYAWEAAFRMALDNPLTGVGLNNFYFNYFYYSSHWDGLNHAVHSTWFGVLAETGILGLTVFIGCIVSLFKTARKTIRQIEKQPDRYAYPVKTMAYAVYAGLVGTVVSGTFLTQGFNWPIYLLAALIISVAQIASQIENQVKK